ncbi:hypothetical protein Klosneuvirus_5_96 [Klosneuvirus KNV1]|uniref:Uncharacterized protein n=1 Tax=Klosneuvirus KNV1 TaxID=1977640 RepID=A0A1V0SL47_9VIRU|nr:hypothetical protein Klosneuvirus_5_96 [Klosneuvirus KNV1]
MEDNKQNEEKIIDSEKQNIITPESDSDLGSSESHNSESNSLELGPSRSVLTYYVVKRSFLFLDEWLFYYALFKLYKNQYYKMFYLIMAYGISCLYTSYKNIDKIEHQMINIKQTIWLTDSSPIELFYHVSEFLIKIYNKWKLNDEDNDKAD